MFSWCSSISPKTISCKVWQSSFEHLLRIRFYSHHARCSQCLRHRLIIKKCGHCPGARRAQHVLLQKHLSRQLRDRQMYWASRARSRLGAANVGECTEITMILDSMDAQKHSWPRSRSMASKEFASFVRPRLSSTTLIMHGFAILTALSPHHISTNSSRTAEILCAGLTMLSKKVDLTSCFLNVQADNCSKEVKNNCTMRLLALWTALHRINGAEMNFLSSGHSHEDVDGLFNLLRAHLESHRELWTPLEFRQCLEKFYDDPSNRPYEPTRSVALLTEFKDWTL